MIGRTNSRCCCRNPHRTHQLLYPSLRAPKFPKNLRSFLKAGQVIVCSILLCAHATSQQIEYRTLPDLIETGSAALEQRNYPLAANAFNSIYQNYQEETVWKNSDLPRRILPITGFASYKSNLHTQAIDALQSYLDEYAEDLDTSLFARYLLASSLLRNGQADSAKNAFIELRAAAGDSPFRDLAILQEAQHLPPEEAIPLLEDLLANPRSQRLANHARLRLITTAQKHGDLERCRIHLLDTPWQSHSESETASLSFLAAQIAANLETDNPGAALSAYQLVLPKSKLLEAQEKRIHRLKKLHRDISPTLTLNQGVWEEHFQASLARLESELQNLHNTPEYFDTITLRKARCFVRINRPIEGAILQEWIASSDSPHARDAHLDRIATHREMRDWSTAAKVAYAFIEKYPNDPDIAQPLLWIALSQIEEKSYQPAITSLQRVLASTSETSFTASAHYYIGYCHYLLQNLNLARSAFSDCYETAPKTPIAGQALLWLGICHFTDNQLETAYQLFEQIRNSPEHSFLHAEAAYRQATTLYATGDLEKAREQCTSWLHEYKIHPRKAEAQVLFGDINTELGQTKAAIAAYQNVDTTDVHLAFHAIDQLSSLLISIDRKTEALSQLRNFQQKHNLPPELAGPFTFSLIRCLDSKTAQKEIDQAISRFGTDPDSTGIIELIQIQQSPTQRPISNPTLESRYLVSDIQTHRSENKHPQAKLKALSLASSFAPDTLAPSASLEAGKALLEIDSQEAPAYFQQIIERHPDSPYAPAAKLNLARHFHKNQQTSLALATLQELPSQTPESLELKLQIEFQLQHYQSAQQTCERLLSEQHATPSQKALALNTLGLITRRADDPLSAYAYHQRVFTLYRGEPAQVAHAYSICIDILYSLNRYNDAQNLADEFLKQTDLSHLHWYQKAKQQRMSAPQPQSHAQTSP
ncbi:tetratricopeptide repeat protein [Pelagicoccus mobilis]|uniref:Tetratricopeptide repeat protein n=1 Tax=Pelagicoccus mobilis TaxID=415221 RepID=A0A934S429_9BACT|nr:tetratricopeptide repeat protein [Pelagicoccus mobilis]MBK1880336.1 tetratricopeptide repeat protein [Pelagicoccus mobilis]